MHQRRSSEASRPPDVGESRAQAAKSAWVVLELSPEGEDLVTSGRLAAHVRADLSVPKTYPVIVPSGDGSNSSVNYVFIRGGLPSSRYFALERRAYAERVLSRHVGNLRTVCYVQGREVEAMLRTVERPRAAPLNRGQVVEVVSGPYLRVRGRVLGPYSSRELIVQVRTRTLLRLLVVHRTDVATVDDRTVPPLFVPDLRQLRRLVEAKPPRVRSVRRVPAAYSSYKQMSFFA